MRYLCLLFPLLVLSACAETNGDDPLACAPNFPPGTAAYKSCLIRQSVVGQDGTEGVNAMPSPPTAPALFCIPLRIDSSCN
jgi:hypothetical protein